MAIVEPLRVCTICKAILIDGMCPEGHELPRSEREEWPDWVKKPVTFTGQSREEAAKRAKRTDTDNVIKESLAANRGINSAMHLLDDQSVLDIMNDAALLVQRALVHRRGEETIKRMMQISAHMAKMAEATNNYVLHCRKTQIPE